ncbi:MAG: glycosyltransferase family 1 protein [bacterium]|nr:glycosyltransferase family 1 protein [bacterium]
MRICLDARKLWDSGIGTYIRGLLHGFSNLSTPVKWDFILSSSEHAHTVRSLDHNIYLSHSQNYSVGELFSVSGLANSTGADLFHAPHYVLPYSLKIPAVVTVHDIIHLKFPHYFSPIKRAYARWMLRRVGASAEIVLTVSNTTKEDLIRELHYPPEKIYVTYPGVGERFFQSKDQTAVQQLLKKYQFPSGYLLYVGNLKPHKNVMGLLEAWALLPNSIRPPLVLVGVGEDQQIILKRRAQSLNRFDELVLPGNFPDEDMVTLYQAASAYVQPSWYEGFGSPPLEALASGLPTAVSNRGALPEIVADAALIFDPGIPGEMAAALEKLLTDTDLRSSLRQRGLKRAESFTWVRTAELTYRAYEIALESR